MTTIKLKNGSGAPTAGDLAQGEPALDLTNKRLYTEDSGGTVIEVGTNPGTDVTFADNRKAVFGAGSDLQIYHDGSNSFIDDTGTGSLIIRAADNLEFQKYTGETYITAAADGAVDIYYNDARKLATTATGIDVTGTVTADGLTVANTAVIAGDFDGGTAATYIRLQDDTDNFLFGSNNSLGNFLIKNETADALRLSVANTGDISFYEDTGTTAKLFWDASAESLAIGHSSPDADLHISGAGNDAKIILEGTANPRGNFIAVEGADDLVFAADEDNLGSASTMRFRVDAAERMRIDSSGNLCLNSNGSIAALDGVIGLQIGNSSASSAGVALENSSRGYLIYASGSDLKFWDSTDNSDRITLDSSGNLLVGGTSAFGADTITLGTGGFAGIRNTSGSCLELRRDTTDGSLLDFQKDGSTVGSIGTEAATLFVSAPQAGGMKYSYLTSTNAVMLPVTTTGANADGLHDLGLSNARFKDLYLSNGINLGGNSAEILEARTETGFVKLTASHSGGGSNSAGFIFRTRNGTAGTNEKMRLTKEGNLLVGDTSSNGGGRIEALAANNANPAIVARSDSASDESNRVLLCSKFTTANTTSQVFVQFAINNNATASGQINANGANQVAFGSWSDYRLKENITDLPSQLANITALRPVEFDYIESEGGAHQLGFVAQEVEEIYPDLVGERNDGMKTLAGLGKWEARLVKAIQEQNEIINDLRARVAQLETN